MKHQFKTRSLSDKTEWLKGLWEDISYAKRTVDDIRPCKSNKKLHLFRKMLEYNSH